MASSIRSKKIQPAGGTGPTAPRYAISVKQGKQTAQPPAPKAKKR